MKDISTQLPCQALEKDDGWCDDVHAKEYNTFVKLPFAGRHEELWRSDRLYDLIVVVGYNDQPPVPGEGSAIFLHITRENYLPGAGCIGFEQKDLLEMLPYLTTDTSINISKTGEMKLENYAKNAQVDLSPSQGRM